MAQPVVLYPKPVVDYQEFVFSDSVLASAAIQALTDQATSLKYGYLRTGRRARLAGVANAVSSGGDNFVTFHLYVNGNPIAQVPFNSFSLALGETYKGDNRQALVVDLPQGALIEVRCDNSDLANAYTATARLRVEYEDL